MVREVDLPLDPRIAGKGLSQHLSVEQMQERLEPVLKIKPHVIKLGGLKTDHLRVECDREHHLHSPVMAKIGNSETVRQNSNRAKMKYDRRNVM